MKAYQKQNYVIFFSPGTIVAEQTIKEIDLWDTDKAVEMSKGIKERHGAVPYAFSFITRENKGTLDSKETKRSNLYYINCKTVTLEQLKAQSDPENKILIQNMVCNKWDKVAQTISGWRWTQPLEESDVVLTG